MGLLFVAGVMNLWWVAAIAGFVLLKGRDSGLRIERMTVTSSFLSGEGSSRGRSSDFCLSRPVVTYTEFRLDGRKAEPANDAELVYSVA